MSSVFLFVVSQQQSDEQQGYQDFYEHDGLFRQFVHRAIPLR